MQLHVLGCNSDGNCYVIQNDEVAYILDAGVSHDKIIRAVKGNISKIRGVFLTHEHGDHAYAANVLSKMHIPIYASDGTLGRLHLKRHSNVREVKFDEFKEVMIRDKPVIGNELVCAMKVEHDAAGPLAFHLKIPGAGDVLYLTDAARYKYSYKKGFDLIIIECNYVDDDTLYEHYDNALAHRIINSHMSLDDTIFAIKNNMHSMTKVLLVHLSDKTADEKKMHYNVMYHANLMGVQVAKNGMVLPVKITDEWR